MQNRLKVFWNGTYSDGLQTFNILFYNNKMHPGGYDRKHIKCIVTYLLKDDTSC